MSDHVTMFHEFFSVWECFFSIWYHEAKAFSQDHIMMKNMTGKNVGQCANGDVGIIRRSSAIPD